MKTVLSIQEPLLFSGTLLVIGRSKGAEASSLEQTIDQKLNGALSKKASRAHFTGAQAQSVLIDTLGQLPAQMILLMGLGEEGKQNGRALRDLIAGVARIAVKERASEVGLALQLSETNEIMESVLGFKLGHYRFDQHQSPNPERPAHDVQELTLFTSQVSAELEAAVMRAKTLSEAVCLARTLVNEPPNICTPERLADLAKSFAAYEGVGVKILDRAEIEARGMGGLVAVSQGATREPRFIHVHYVPKGEAKGSLALIGKGLTFDSGGLSLKPPKAQELMHIDMGGAAAVLGAMSALVQLQPNVELHAIVGACENMPDGNSVRPSDILTMYSKKTVEVLNTDAEGRLVLADALHYASELKPNAMVNLATLTGACMVGLGSNYCGIFSDEDHWAEQLLTAGQEAGEHLWRLPLDEGLADTLKSKRADIKNIGGPYGGAITAALFLKHFKGDCTWGHMDIAGPTHSAKDSGSVCEGGTGFGVLTLIALAENFNG